MLRVEPETAAAIEQWRKDAGLTNKAHAQRAMLRAAAAFLKPLDKLRVTLRKSDG